MLNSEMLHLFLETNKQKSNAVLFGGGRGAMLLEPSGFYERAEA